MEYCDDVLVNSQTMMLNPVEVVDLVLPPFEEKSCIVPF